MSARDRPVVFKRLFSTYRSILKARRHIYISRHGSILLSRATDGSIQYQIDVQYFHLKPPSAISHLKLPPWLNQYYKQSFASETWSTCGGTTLLQFPVSLFGAFGVCDHHDRLLPRLAHLASRLARWVDIAVPESPVSKPKRSNVPWHTSR